MRTLGLIGILSIAVLRSLVVFGPQVIFDVDPTLDPIPLLGFGPAESLLLDVLLLLSCAIALIGEWLSGRGLNWIVLLLALIPAPLVLWHGAGDAGNLWLGSTWLAAAIACVAMAHLARDPRFRILAMSVLLAAIVPILTRSVVQVYHEHPATIAFYEEHRAEILHDRGWSPDSPAAQIYERRLREPQPLGWFSTSNILASLAAFGVAAWFGLSIAAARAKLQSGWAAAMALLAGGASVLLLLSGSKGAALAAIAGLMMVVAPLMRTRLTVFFSTHGGRIVIALLVLALIGVIVRGAALSESFANEKSLLFRWHYLIASARIFLDHLWLGVGPDGFQAAYMLHRVPRNPEEVASAHSVFVDWLCTLGICGAAWIGLTLVLLARSARPSELPNPDQGTSPRKHRDNENNGLVSSSVSPRLSGENRLSGSVFPPAAIVLLVFVPSIVTEWPSLDDDGLRARALGIAGFIGTAILISVIASRSAEHLIRSAWMAGIAALLVHAQIEMTLTQPSSVVWCLCAIGALGLREPLSERAPRRHGCTEIGKGVINGAVLCAILIAAGWIAVNGWLPAARQQRTMLAAATLLDPVRAQPKDVSLMLKQRAAAAEELVRAYEQWPIDVRPLHAAAIQLEMACTTPDPGGEMEGPQPLGLLLRARDLLDIAILRHEKTSSMAIAVGINVRLAQLTGDTEHWIRAIDLSRTMTQRDPHGLGTWKRLGDVLWAAGERREAASAYQRALECDANFVLDEMKRLPAEQREQLERRIATAQ